MRSQTIVIPGKTWTQPYEYSDSVNRLGSVTERGVGAWTRTFKYDKYGNPWVTSPGLNQFTPTDEANFDLTNRLKIQNSTYGDAGNQTGIGGFTFQWDGEGRLVSSVFDSSHAGRRFWAWSGTAAGSGCRRR